LQVASLHQFIKGRAGIVGGYDVIALLSLRTLVKQSRPMCHCEHRFSCEV